MNAAGWHGSAPPQPYRQTRTLEPECNELSRIQRRCIVSCRPPTTSRVHAVANSAEPTETATPRGEAGAPSGVWLKEDSATGTPAYEYSLTLTCSVPTGRQGSITSRQLFAAIVGG